MYEKLRSKTGGSDWFARNPSADLARSALMVNLTITLPNGFTVVVPTPYYTVVFAFFVYDPNHRNW